MMRTGHRLRYDPAALVADLVLVLYAELLGGAVLARGGWLVKGMPVDLLLLLGVAVDFFLLWQLGLLAHAWCHGGAALLERRWYVPAGLAAALLALWVVAALHLTMFFSVLEAAGRRDFLEALPRFFPFGAALLFGGLAMGGIQGALEWKRRRGENIAAERLGVLVKLFPAACGMLLVYAAWRIMGSFLPALLAGAALTTGGVLLLRRLRARAAACPGPVREHKLFYNFVFPLLVFTLLCVWTELQLLAKAAGARAPLSRGGLFFHLLVTGVIPLRLLLALQPPFRVLTLLTGALSIGYFLHGVLRLVP